MDLADRWSFCCVLDEAGKINLEQKSTDNTGSDEADIWKDNAKSDRTGDRNTLSLGKPAVNGAGTPSDRGAPTKSAIDHQEQSKRGSARRANAGKTGAHRPPSCWGQYGIAVST